MISAPETKEFKYEEHSSLSGLIVLSTGFEDRAREFISKVSLDENATVILVKFENDIEVNDMVYEEYRQVVANKVAEENITTVALNQSCPRSYISDLEIALQNMPREINKIWLDISGMPSHAICASLHVVRAYKPSYPVNVIYTSAQKYHPNKDEYDILKEKQAEGVEYLPSSLAKEMSENLILSQFSGQRTNEGQSCLALFAGYEVHRSAGVIENVNPSMLLLLYGRPEGDGLDWRLDLSKQLHQKFEKTRKSAVEEASTLHLKEALEYLDQYYEYIYDEYDLTISPVCSKMNAVAAYLFWEMYREVQLIFPLPIGYATDKKAERVGQVYITTLEPKNSLFRVSLDLTN